MLVLTFFLDLLNWNEYESMSFNSTKWSLQMLKIFSSHNQRTGASRPALRTLRITTAALMTVSLFSVAQSQNVYSLRSDEIVATATGTCGFIDGRWIPGKVSSKGFVPLKNSIRKVKKALKKAQGEEATALRKKLAKLKKRNRLRSADCNSILRSGPTVTPGAQTSPLPTSRPIQPGPVVPGATQTAVPATLAPGTPIRTVSPTATAIGTVPPVVTTSEPVATSTPLPGVTVSPTSTPMVGTTLTPTPPILITIRPGLTIVPVPPTSTPPVFITIRPGITLGPIATIPPLATIRPIITLSPVATVRPFPTFRF
jgi:hypothetical protein